ncbi:MAG: alpha/beta hydrolase [Lentimicrobiaceae bacterium]|jgi:pimeloyl-ACP methyl ester carboxylesterase
MIMRKEIIFLILMLGIHQVISAQEVANSSTDTTRYGQNDLAGNYIRVNGIDMYYEIYGQGEPLLMIHGNGGSINSFINQIPYFSKNYKVIVADSRAQGRSEDLQDSLSFEMMADDFSTLLDSLHIDSCNVLGWSDGGINGLLLAIRHPEKVKKLAITGANLWPDSTAISAADYKWGLSFYDTLVKMPQTPDIAKTLKLVKLDTFQPHITTEQLHQIKCPTLVIGGDHDIILPKHTLLIAESIPGAYLWILPNSSHGTLIDYKDRFNEVAGEFFGNRLKK